MSSSVDVRPRSDIWSYFSLSQTPRNRRSSSVTLPTRSTPGSAGNRGTSSQAANGAGHYPRTAAVAGKAGKGDAAAPQGRVSVGGGDGGGTIAMLFSRRQRTRYVRTGAVVACLLLVIFFLMPAERQKVEKYVGGTALESACFGSNFSQTTRRSAAGQRSHRTRRQAQRGAASRPSRTSPSCSTS
jgi:hypothetical protein